MKKTNLFCLLLCLAATAHAQSHGVSHDVSRDAQTTATLSHAEGGKIVSINITGNSSIPEDALAQNLEANGIVVGQELNFVRLERLRQHVIDHYRYFRRYEAKVETHVKALDNDTYEVTLFIDEQSQKEELPAGYNHDPYADDIYTDSPPQRAQNSINNGLSVSNEHQTQAQDEEDPRVGTISLGLGYGNKGTNYQISLIKRRLFDTDASMRLSGIHDRYETNLDLGVSKPNVLGSRIRLDTNIFYDSFDNSRNKIVAPYRRKSYGLQATLNFPIDSDSSYYTGLRYTHNSIKDFTPEYHRALYLNSIKQQDWHFKANDVDLLLGWKYNDFNHKFFPTKGFGINLEGNVSLPGSDNKYYKVKLDAKTYYPLNSEQSWLIGLKTSLGYAKGMHKHLVPFYQNFTAGGEGSLRGFSYGSIGPHAVYSPFALKKAYTIQPLYTKTSQHVIGGNALAAGSLELVVPNFYLPENYRHSMRTSVFIDAASVWETNSQHIHPLAFNNAHSKRIRASAGLSLQWQFPMGVLSISYAVPIKKYSGDRTEQLQLSIKGSF